MPMRLAVCSLLSLAFIPAHADKIDAYVKQVMAEGKVPGMTIGIIRNGKLVSERAYGVSDLELQSKTTKDDIFEIGSMTKQFTAFGAMMLVDEGKIGLEDPVSKYIPEAPDAWKDIKVRNLLNQNSGLQDYAFVPGIGLLDDFDRKTWMDKMTKLPLDFEPGLTWAYSNSNYALLGWIIEKAAGMPYKKFMTERVLQPLGMTHTTFDDTSLVITHRAHGYLHLTQDLTRSKVGGGMSIDSDGSLMSNIEDLAKWDDALREHKLLKQSSYDLIWSPGKLNSGRVRFYGMGWFLAAPGSVPYEGHGGNSIGYSAGIARYPAKGITVVILCNVYAINGEGTAKGVAELYDPSLAPVVPKESPDPDPARTEHVKAAILAVGSGKADADLLDPELLAPMKTARAGAAGPSPLKNVDALNWCGVTEASGESFLTYRLKSGARWFTLYALLTPEGKLAAYILRTDPVK